MRRPLILIVEDDPIVRDLTARQLTILGFESIAVRSGEEAIEKDNGSFNLILMDIGLPGIDGIQATMLIRENELREHRPRTPIVALTAHADSKRCKMAGMDDFLQKPALLNDLKNTLSKWIKSQESA